VFIATFVVHFVGGFSVQLMTEAARRSAIRAEARAERAEIEASSLRRQLETVQATENVEAWASLNGFTSSYLVLNEAPTP
jgi:hypothetical protein